mmetsp:Transcript_8937/g.25962  ORF Transcript_8937/g.25962 Transcript_8937/m.25962 type:complete len:253 (+) Transcript_8937:183-941(+)
MQTAMRRRLQVLLLALAASASAFRSPLRSPSPRLRPLGVTNSNPKLASWKTNDSLGRASDRRGNGLFGGREAAQIEPAEVSDLFRITRLCIDVFFGPTERLWPWQRSQLSRLTTYQRLDLQQRHTGQEGVNRRVAMFKVRPAEALGESTPKGDAEEVIGFVEVMEKVPGGSYNKTFDDPERNARCFAANLAVSPKARKQGIGKRLLAEAEAQAGEWGYSELYVQVDEDNVEACRFYERLGFNFLLRDPAARR